MRAVEVLHRCEEGDGVKKTYGELLRDPRWQKRRLQILDRAEFHCEECDDDQNTLHVHHKVYRKGAMPWEYGDHELKALCENCHQSGHALKAALDLAIAEMDTHDKELLLGFIEAMKIIDESMDSEDFSYDTSLNIRSVGHAIGVGKAVGLSIFAARLRFEGKVSYRDICDAHWDQYTKAVERMRGIPEFKAAWDAHLVKMHGRTN